MVKVKVMRRNEQGEMEELALKPQIMTEELAELIGAQSDPAILEVERGVIKRYVQAIGDPNPLYSDVEYAKKSRYGKIICPPGFFGWPVKPDSSQQPALTSQILKKTGRTTVIDIATELEFMLPVGAGDILISVRKLADLFEEVGRSGNRLLVGIFETTYINQNGDTVAKSRQRLIYA